MQEGGPHRFEHRAVGQMFDSFGRAVAEATLCGHGSNMVRVNVTGEEGTVEYKFEVGHKVFRSN